MYNKFGIVLILVVHGFVCFNIPNDDMETEMAKNDCFAELFQPNQKECPKDASLCLEMNYSDDCFERNLRFVKDLKSQKLVCQGLKAMLNSRELQPEYVDIVEGERQVTCDFLETLKNYRKLIIENVEHTGEVLFPWNQELIKIKESQVKSTGRVMAEYASVNPPNYNNWILIPKKDSPNNVQIYNEGTGGFLNAYEKIQSDQRRDVFVTNDKQDFWKIHKHPVIEGAIAFENLPTGEYLYAIEGAKGRQIHLRNFPAQTTRPVYLWTYKTKKALNDDHVAFWYLKESK